MQPGSSIESTTDRPAGTARRRCLRVPSSMRVFRMASGESGKVVQSFSALTLALAAASATRSVSKSCRGLQRFLPLGLLLVLCLRHAVASISA